MNALFDICCGEVEEETKPGAFVDDDFSEDDDDKNGDPRHKYLHSNSSSLEKAHVAMKLRRQERVTVYSKPINVQSSQYETFSPKVYEKTQAEIDFLKQALKSHFIFEELHDNELQILVNAMMREEISNGTTIVRQDDQEQYLYVIERGDVNLYCERGQATVGTLHSGDFFGDVSLLYDGSTSVQSIIAHSVQKDGPVVVWRVDQLTFRRVLAQHSYHSHLDLKDSLKQVELFKSFDDATLTKFTTALSHVVFEPNDLIVKKGTIGDYFYIIEEGSVKVHDIGLGDGSSVDQVLYKGDWFGERALLSGDLRAANVTAITKVKTLAMDRQTFEESVGQLEDILSNHEKVQCLKALPIFATTGPNRIEESEFQKLALVTTETCYRKGKKLAEAGKPYQLKVWMIRKGKLLVYGGGGSSNNDTTSNGSHSQQKIYNLKSGDYFGDKSILGDPDHLSSHDAVCEENLTCWTIDKSDIEDVIGDLSRLGQAAGFRKHGSAEKTLKLRDLTKKRILGVGGFGQVWLVETTKKYQQMHSTLASASTAYALKVINKRKLLNSHQQDGVLREKDLLALLQHPFILNLVSSFQDVHNLYLVLPLIQGGELFNVLATQSAKTGFGLPNNHAAFYSACVIEALGHFHHRHIAYRDMKLENVMIDSEGYAKIVDLGFAKVVVDKTYTFCGTPDYLAPEIIMSKGYSHAVDYWAFGVMLFEMLVGKSPFHKPTASQMDMFKRIVMVNYAFPASKKVVNEDSRDLVGKLLVRPQSKRLGNLARGHVDIRLHPWFGNSNCFYKKLIKREIKAPWIPPIKNPLDSSNFDDHSELEKQTNYGGLPLSKEEQALFKGF